MALLVRYNAGKYNLPSTTASLLGPYRPLPNLVLYLYLDDDFTADGRQNEPTIDLLRHRRRHRNISLPGTGSFRLYKRGTANYNKIGFGRLNLTNARNGSKQSSG